MVAALMMTMASMLTISTSTDIPAAQQAAMNELVSSIISRRLKVGNLTLDACHNECRRVVTPCWHVCHALWTCVLICKQWWLRSQLIWDVPSSEKLSAFAVRPDSILLPWLGRQAKSQRHPVAAVSHCQAKPSGFQGPCASI